MLITPFASFLLLSWAVNALVMIQSEMSKGFRATRLWNQLLNSFMEGMELKRKRWRLRSYDHCFSGAEALDWMYNYVQNNPSFTNHVKREQIFCLLQKFLENGVFENATGKDRGKFQDTNVLYKFKNQNQPTEIGKRERISDSRFGNILRNGGTASKERDIASTEKDDVFSKDSYCQKYFTRSNSVYTRRRTFSAKHFTHKEFFEADNEDDIMNHKHILGKPCGGKSLPSDEVNRRINPLRNTLRRKRRNQEPSHSTPTKRITNSHKVSPTRPALNSKLTPSTRNSMRVSRKALSILGERSSFIEEGMDLSNCNYQNAMDCPEKLHKKQNRSPPKQTSNKVHTLRKRNLFHSNNNLKSGKFYSALNINNISVENDVMRRASMFVENRSESKKENMHGKLFECSNDNLSKPKTKFHFLSTFRLNYKSNNVVTKKSSKIKRRKSSKMRPLSFVL